MSRTTDRSSWPDAGTLAQARPRIADIVYTTPVLTSTSLNAAADAELFFKCENFQRTGSFKIRGAVNAVSRLADTAGNARVVTHSSGNHGQALAYAARARGMEADMVVPNTAPAVKIRAIEGYGGRITPCEPTMSARAGAVDRIVDATGAVYISSNDHPDIIAGQASVFAEMHEECGELDYLFAPLGGGGLLSGSVLAAAAMAPSTTVVGVVPELADDAYRSLAEGRRLESVYPPTIADGLKVSIGQLPFEILQATATMVIRVSETAIIQAMRDLWERMKIVVEPSAAVAYAGLASGAVDVAGKRAGVILSGGNVDLDRLPWRDASERNDT